MSLIFLATGNCTLGIARTDKDGNITESAPAKFEFADDGSCVAIGYLNPETGEPLGELADMFADWDAAGYLARVLERLKPSRPVNIPDLAAITKAAMKDGVDLCEYCHGINCQECVVAEWKEEGAE